jgi:hypothetical protein
MGRNDLAERYLAQVIREHGATEDSRESERLLAEINKNYKQPPADALRKEKFVHTFQRNTIPLEQEPVMVVPENSDGKWLLPVRDLKKNVIENTSERKVNTNEF